MIDLVQQGFDLAITPVSPLDSTLVKRTLSKWNYALYGAAVYLETHGAPRSPADLGRHNCLRYAYAACGPEFYFTDPTGNRVLARLRGDLVTTSIVVMRTAPIAGLDCGLSPPFIVSDLLASGGPVPLLSEYGTPQMEIVALYPHGRQLSAKVQLFLDRLIDWFAEEQR
jgi:DNA-binding transcriptional LysR family regulator